ncbi:MAG TPA: DeoR/GlpR family DNA-binding transcription regulator [Paracoccaceae bacterium]|nr:DeoR/GlpR family DNA-binding transcription regulator [Paracoccaceae bacterium]
MVQNFRQSQILALARETGKVTVEDLAARFEVTSQTIRRDLGELCEAGHLARVHGGAVVASNIVNIGYQARRVLNAGAKAAIGRLCAAAIPNGVSLFINIGTSTEAMARALISHHDLMVITNNINVANILAASPGCEIIVAGGILRRSDGGLVGEVTADFIRRFKVDFAIIGASALDEDGSMLDYDYREVRVAQEIIANARKTFLVADASKFARSAPMRIASLTDIDAFFTDLAPPPPVTALCAAAGVEVHVARGSAESE